MIFSFLLFKESLYFWLLTLRRLYEVIFIFLSLCILAIVRCRTQSEEIPSFDVNPAQFSKYINSKPMPDSPNLVLDKSIINNDYPKEIALYWS